MLINYCVSMIIDQGSQIHYELFVFCLLVFAIIPNENALNMLYSSLNLLEIFLSKNMLWDVFAI